MMRGRIPHDVWDKFRGEPGWLQARTIALFRAGSHAYGTATPESDLDVRGICVAPRRTYHGFAHNFEQANSGCWTDLDCQIFEVRRFFQLAAEGNPNIIEMPFTDEADYLECWSAWDRIVARRELFLSRAVCVRFSRYASGQLKRMETHRRWLLNQPTHKPTRAEFGLPDEGVIPKEQRDVLEGALLKTVESWQVDLACLDEPARIDLLARIAAQLADMKLAGDGAYNAAAQKIGVDAHAMEWLKAERSYRAALAEWNQFQTWLKERNPARAALEARFGYDTKHAMHLVRLLRMAVEIAEGKGVIVRRPDAEELLEIRRGGWSYDYLRAWASAAEKLAEITWEESKLPRQPDREALDVLCMEVVESMLS